MLPTRSRIVQVFAVIIIMGLAAHAGGDGPPKSWTMPAPSGERIVTRTIIVPKGETMDFNNTRLVPDRKLGDGSQREAQRPVIAMMKGSSVKNVIIGGKGADGIHCRGENTLSNVWFEDVGEDALTVEGANVRWIGGGARKAEDKIVQLNHKGPFHGENLYFENFTTGVRGNGNKSFGDTPFRVTLKNIGARDGICLLRFSSKGAHGEMQGIFHANIQHLGRADNGSKIDWLDKPAK